MGKWKVIQLFFESAGLMPTAIFAMRLIFWFFTCGKGGILDAARAMICNNSSRKTLKMQNRKRPGHVRFESIVIPSLFFVRLRKQRLCAITKLVTQSSWQLSTFLPQASFTGALCSFRSKYNRWSRVLSAQKITYAMWTKDIAATDLSHICRTTRKFNDLLWKRFLFSKLRHVQLLTALGALRLSLTHFS